MKRDFFFFFGEREKIKIKIKIYFFVAIFRNLRPQQKKTPNFWLFILCLLFWKFFFRVFKNN